MHRHWPGKKLLRTRFLPAEHALGATHPHRGRQHTCMHAPTCMHAYIYIYIYIHIVDLVAVVLVACGCVRVCSFCCTMPGVCSGAAGAHGTPVPLRRVTGARLHWCVPCSSRNLALQVCKGDAATGPVSEARAQALRVLVPHNLAASARPRHVSPSLHSSERCRVTRVTSNGSAAFLR